MESSGEDPGLFFSSDSRDGAGDFGDEKWAVNAS